jgi:hypothetical protein
MNKSTIYVPILKARLGEFSAVQTMPVTERSQVVPLFEVPPVPWDHQNHVPAKTVDEHLKNLTKHVQSSWGPDRVCFADLGLLHEAERMASGIHPIRAMFEGFRRHGLKVVPVTGLIRDNDHQISCLETLKIDGLGICIRLQPEDFRDEFELNSSLDDLLKRFELTPREVDLILDLGPLEQSVRSHASRAARFISALPTLESWRTFVVAATGFPVNLMGFPQSAISNIPREEWALWRGLISDPSISRKPVFGDYGIAHAEHSDIDPRKMTTSACIRYTSDRSWVICRGKGLKAHGFQQFHDVARRLMGHVSYKGPEFSWGDNYIADCAKRNVGCGNLTTWRRVGTSHHIAFVNRQVAETRVPSADRERSRGVPVG